MGRDERMEAAADALQVAGLQAGHLRRALTDMMADVATLHAALERARTALGLILRGERFVASVDADVRAQLSEGSS